MKIHIENDHNIHEKDRVYIDAYGDVIDVTLAMSFLHDTLHKFLLFFFVIIQIYIRRRDCGEIQACKNSQK